MREGSERACYRQLAQVAGAIVRFHAQDGHQQRRRHPELPLDAGEQQGVALHQHFGALDAGRGDAGGGVALEGAVLAAVEGEHRRIERDPANALSITPREMPWPCASRAIAPRKLLKSPPHGAAPRARSRQR